MTETVLWLFGGVLILAVLRSIIGIVLKGISDFFGTATSNPPANGGGPRPASRAAAPQTPEALKKDPVCGTFVAPSSAVRKTVNGETYYFCSAACRDKFRA